jgi:hypothetical protein
MLRPVKLVDRVTEIERSLPDKWAEAELLLTVEDDARSDRAAALLAPANPGRRGKKIRFSFARRGPGLPPEALRRLLRRLDEEGIAGELELVEAEEASPAQLDRHESLREQWNGALATLPSDWSDVYAEVELDSTDFVEPGALLLAPLNPALYGGPATLRFRCAHHFGYGASPEMARRCFERCDRDLLTGHVRILRALSDTYPVATQGPVWYVGDRVV